MSNSIPTKLEGIYRVADTTFSIPLIDTLIPAVLLSIYSGALKPNGYGRQYLSHVNIPREVSTKVFARFGIDDYLDEPMFGNFIGLHNLDGAAVHPHTDPAPIGYHHVRCNLAIEMSVHGGYPVLDGDILPVRQGFAWICFASIEQHGSTPIEGGRRIVLSLGGLVEKSLAEHIFNQIS